MTVWLTVIGLMLVPVGIEIFKEVSGKWPKKH